MIRGLSWPALLSLAVQKGTNWQWANESSLSPSGAQLPPLHSWPSLLFTFVVFPLLYLSPLLHFLHCFSSFTFPFWTTSCPFFLVLSVAALRPLLPLWIVGLQSQTRTVNHAAIRLTTSTSQLDLAFSSSQSGMGL